MKDYVYKYYFPSFTMIRSNVDKRTFKDMITKSGYESQEFEVQTKDGYIINMNRICNRKAFNVVYF